MTSLNYFCKVGLTSFLGVNASCREACTWRMVGTLALAPCSGPTRPSLCLQAPTCIFWTEMHPGLSVQKRLQQGLCFVLALQLWSLNCASTSFGEYVRGSLGSFTFGLSHN